MVFLRGLAVVENTLVIGCSVNFKNGPSAIKNAYIKFIELTTGDYVDYQLDGIESINDLKVI
jgi:hypothetical protein